MLSVIRNWYLRFSHSASNRPTKLPSQVNDNQYLAASANAAILDKQTGAYDKYLFEDKEIPEMPYETAVDSHLELMSLRMSQRFRRHISAANLRKIKANRRVQTETLRQKFATEERDTVEKQLANQISILEGKQTGKLGLTWIGEVPDLLNPLSASIRLLGRYLVFLVIGVIDLYIIWRSIQNLGIPAIESGFLTAPAVAAQLVFPHLAGSRIALLVRGLKKPSVWAEILVLLGVWLTFVYVISAVRVMFLMQEISRRGDVAGENDEQIFIALNLILLMALGGWLIFLSIRENPHEISALKSKIKLRQLDRALLKVNSRLAKSQEQFEAADEMANALIAELNEAVNSSRHELSQAAKSIYRRALINEMADPEFTKSYFSDSGDPK